MTQLLGNWQFAENSSHLEVFLVQHSRAWGSEPPVLRTLQNNQAFSCCLQPLLGCSLLTSYSFALPGGHSVQCLLEQRNPLGEWGESSQWECPGLVVLECQWLNRGASYLTSLCKMTVWAEMLSQLFSTSGLLLSAGHCFRCGHGTQASQWDDKSVGGSWDRFSHV